MKKIIVKPGVEIDLGKRGENLARCVVFDISAWETTYGEGTVHLLHQRNGDKAPYPCVVKVSGGKVRWNLTETDLDVAGRGRAELQYFVGEARVKSETWVTRTERTLNNAGPVPEEPAENWLNTMLELGTETQENAQAAEEAAQEAAEIAESVKASEEVAQSSADLAAEHSEIAVEAASDAEAAMQAAETARDEAEQAAGKNSYIGENGNWFAWDNATGGFVDTGLPSRGVSGVYVGTGEMPEGYSVQIDPDGEVVNVGLPEVTETDNGKVLRVVDGEWAASKGGEEDTEERLTELENQMADLLYKAISITSFTHNAGTKEMGDTVTAVTLSWSINKQPKSLTLDGEALSVNLVKLALSDLSITKDNNKTWTLKATDEREATSTKTTTISFQNGIYHGGAAMPETIDSAFIMALEQVGGKVLTGTKNRTVTIAGGDGKYAWYAYPKRLGTSLFNIGGFDYEYELTTISFTNKFGFTEDYYVYRSGQYAPASLSVTVKNGG